jgi:hypothetical protein
MAQAISVNACCSLLTAMFSNKNKRLAVTVSVVYVYQDTSVLQVSAVCDFKFRIWTQMVDS